MDEEQEFFTLVKRGGWLYVKSTAFHVDEQVTRWWPTGISFKALLQTSSSEKEARALLNAPLYRKNGFFHDYDGRRWHLRDGCNTKTDFVEWTELRKEE